MIKLNLDKYNINIALLIFKYLIKAYYSKFL